VNNSQIRSPTLLNYYSIWNLSELMKVAVVSLAHLLVVCHLDFAKLMPWWMPSLIIAINEIKELIMNMKSH